VPRNRGTTDRADHFRPDHIAIRSVSPSSVDTGLKSIDDAIDLLQLGHLDAATVPLAEPGTQAPSARPA
jgi:hypothetical protein